MNHGTVTGGVVKEAASAYTATLPRIRRVLFSIAIRDSHHQSSVWNCEAEGDDVMLDLIESQAQPGRGVKLEYELATRPFMKSGVHTGEIRYLRVMRCEFPERAPRHAEASTEGEE
jgi:hypothetical protein